MKITYDPEVDVVRIGFSSTPIEESDEEKPGVILDFDKDGNVVLEAAPGPLDSSEFLEYLRE
jgi:uncharacterized protein YuzE